MRRFYDPVAFQKIVDQHKGERCNVCEPNKRFPLADHFHAIELGLQSDGLRFLLRGIKLEILSLPFDIQIKIFQALTPAGREMICKGEDAHE